MKHPIEKLMLLCGFSQWKFAYLVEPEEEFYGIPYAYEQTTTRAKRKNRINTNPRQIRKHSTVPQRKSDLPVSDRWKKQGGVCQD